MKVSLKWLNEYVEVPTDIKAFCDKLDLTGTGVEGVETLGATFDHVVTAKVLKKASFWETRDGAFLLRPDRKERKKE